MVRGTKISTATWRAKWPYELRKIKYFNMNSARLEIHFELWERYTGWRGKVKYRVMGYSSEVGKIPYRGDLAWARRIAKQYNLKVPK